MKIIKLDKAQIKKVQSAPRNRYVQEFLDLNDDEAMSFDDYDEMRRVYYAITSYCRTKDIAERPKQFSKTSENTFMIWRDRGKRNA